MSSEIIYKYFPKLNSKQKEQIDKLFDLYFLWNSQINVISRKDIDLLYERHILHSLAIAKVCEFKPGQSVLDVGTGGGFPGIPLAILFPETKFHLVDSIGKKIKVVSEVAKGIGLKNLKATHSRAEQIDEKFDFVVSRAVTQLKDFYPWIRDKFKKDSISSLKNGVLYLKGGDLEQELKESKLKNIALYPLKDLFEEEFFETKYVVYVPVQ
ncbi:16S rRNA m(7)G-527 methyltransferase [Pseudopedobacter saltans DSM 12145]|uniref:Ribosomal RNA small subunit methyltransferase G n=1 Tax=Pseudopedobacter saltans (strain ATCC 51119 / DSM 12145 / JCM 21818 / CCUG 39354 / LMG 10337 / NBRC 100064 / NCIMB 13643) TaxID=762903 RepID=F0S8R2_PSESL|nr:16S rRNA (guanine(527)-N(7))-methyltransferase RsmG [Pseudopedobacter saltans]ADY52393.1 16S rRNA m(7)G-527 methyltransferase [Pseudopedobacter saltans DSM 12145]